MVLKGRKAGESSSSSSALVEGLWTENFPNRLTPGPRLFVASDSESEDDEDNSELSSSSGGGDSTVWSASELFLPWLVNPLPPKSLTGSLDFDVAVISRGD